MNLRSLAISATLALLPAGEGLGNQLTEADIIKLTKDAPAVKGMKLGANQADLSANQFQEQYSSQLVTGLNYSDSNELPTVTGAPVFAPTSTYSAAIQRKLRNGMAVSLTGLADQRSSNDGKINNLSKSSLEAKVSMDLWKNFLGKFDDQQWQSLQLQRQMQDLEAEINSQSFSYDVRKIYWSLLANRESQRLANGLLSNAKRQLKETKRRFKASVANASDVARLNAQVSSRKNILNSLKMQQTALEQSLVNALPQLAGQQLSLAPVNLETVILDIMQCTNTIQSSSTNPLDNTKYHELLKLLDRKYDRDQSIASSYTDADVQLMGSYKIAGQANTYADSMENINDQTLTGFSVGLQLTIPLGAQKTNSQASLNRAQRNAYEYEKNMLLAQLKAERQAISPQIDLLYASIQEQKRNSQLLKQSSKSIEKQYKQARISIMELIREQDALQDSQLKEIDAYLLVINSLFDYLKMFQETPCKLNS